MEEMFPFSGLKTILQANGDPDMKIKGHLPRQDPARNLGLNLVLGQGPALTPNLQEEKDHILPSPLADEANTDLPPLP